MEMNGSAGIVKVNVDLVQENKRLRAEIEARDKRIADMRIRLKHERYLANRYREIRREKCQVRGWLRRVWEGMDEAWAVRVIIGTAIMCGVCLAIGWVMV